MQSLKVSAPGKIILSGEHSVVYGYPAILAAVNKRLTITASGGKKIIESEIPIGSGMGSSAAFAVTSSALKCKLQGKKWDLMEINKLAYEMEKKQHGRPSGGDNTVSTYGGYLWYRKESESLKIFSPIKVKKRIPEFYPPSQKTESVNSRMNAKSFLLRRDSAPDEAWGEETLTVRSRELHILDSGKPMETTGEMVAQVKKSPLIFNRIEEITKLFLRFLSEEENCNFNELIRENERLLEKIGVVSDLTMKLIRKIEKLGGSAKISGAGGKKSGSGIILVFHKQPEVILRLANDLNLKLMKVKLGEEGVKIEN